MMIKRPIGLAIAFTIVLSLMTHEPKPAIQATPANVPPTQQAETPQGIQPTGPVADPTTETKPTEPQSDGPQLEQNPPQKLDVPQRIASLVPGVERFFEATTRK